MILGPDFRLKRKPERRLQIKQLTNIPFSSCEHSSFIIGLETSYNLTRLKTITINSNYLKIYQKPKLILHVQANAASNIATKEHSS